MLNETASPASLSVAETAMPVNQGRLFRQRNKMTVAPKIQMLGHRGVAILREIPQARQFNDLVRRQDRANDIRLRPGVNVIQVTLRDGLLHKLLDALVQRAFNDHVGTRFERSANAFLVDGWPFSKRCGSAKINSGIGHAW